MIDAADYPVICAGTDMGWQHRRSNSASGHAFFVGFHTRKAIVWILFSKRCAICRAHGAANGAAVGGPVRDHDCSKNYRGSSKAMESRAVLDMYVQMYRTKQVTIGLVIADDDTSMKQS